MSLPPSASLLMRHKPLPSTYQNVDLVGWNHRVEFPMWEITKLLSKRRGLSRNMLIKNRRLWLWKYRRMFSSLAYAWAQMHVIRNAASNSSLWWMRCLLTDQSGGPEESGAWLFAPVSSAAFQQQLSLHPYSPGVFLQGLLFLTRGLWTAGRTEGIGLKCWNAAREFSQAVLCWFGTHPTSIVVCLLIQLFHSFFRYQNKMDDLYAWSERDFLEAPDL